MRLLDIDGFDPYSESAHAFGGESEHEYKIPDVISILPIRNAVAFPGTVMPLAIGRDRSKALLDELDNDEVIGLVAQKNADIDKPEPKDFYKVGTISSVLKIIQMPQGSMTVIVHGLVRFRIDKIVQTEPYIKAKITPLYPKTRMTKKIKALMVSVRQAANRVIALSPNAPEEASIMLENLTSPLALADFIAATLNVPLKEKQAFLEEFNPAKCLQKVSLALASQLELLELSNKIQGQVRESIDKTQREYFLQEQLKAIETELGMNDRKSDEILKIKKMIDKAKMPHDVKEEALRELDRLSKISHSSPEYSVIRTYLDWVCELPWSIKSEDLLDIAAAEKILNADHYGLKKVKKRILEFLAVRKLNPKGKSPILCFAGPPGVGKTSLGKSIARAMGRKFVRISLGGMRDEADIRGHRRTYIGALPGRIMQELRKCKTNNPVFMLDELDKIGQDFRGDPASALLEVLDPEQNNTFTDHYLDQPFDLSNVMFIGTANYTENIPEALYDRMEVIELAGYTAIEKLNIAKKYLIPRQLKEHGLKKSQLTIKDECINMITESYTAESGVRNLEREIAAICRSVATDIARGKKRKATITKSSLHKLLGPVKYESEVAMRKGSAGVVTGLAWTPYGGEILFIETISMQGKGELTLTGQLGDVMRESAQAAFSLIKSKAHKYKLDDKTFKEFDYHIHVPAGAIPKDGPSAGVGMFTSLLSLMLGLKVRPDVAMTGEITLQGLVLPIGGLKEKILAAKHAGIKKVILPYRNKKDMVEVPAEAKKGMEFVFVKKVDELLKHTIA